VPLPKSKEEVKETDNSQVMGVDMVPETPAISDPDTGEYEAIMKGRSSEYNPEEYEEMTA
jgi:hypothetical protein